jgi:hypothetical protein
MATRITDYLAPARGIALGFVLGLTLWGVVIWLLWRALS